MHYIDKVYVWIVTCHYLNSLFVKKVDFEKKISRRQKSMQNYPACRVKVFIFYCSLVHLLKPEINPIFADKATVIIETAR